MICVLSFMTESSVLMSESRLVPPSLSRRSLEIECEHASLEAPHICAQEDEAAGGGA